MRVPTEAVVLAGGAGTRLRSVVSDVPKPMASVAGRPFLSYVLDLLCLRGISRIVLSVGYKSDAIRSYFGDRYQGRDLLYSVEDSPLGTGGAIALASTRVTEERLFVVNGDSFIDPPFEAMANIQAESGAEIVMAVRHLQDCGRYGRVRMSQNTITGFEEKTGNDAGYVNAGVYLINTGFARSLDLGRAFSFESDVLERRCREVLMLAVPVESYFIDIGIPDDYLRAQEELPGVMSRIKGTCIG